MKRILFVLQNAYRSDKYNFKNDEEWSRDLFRSHTGRRLKEMIPDGVEYFVINSSPEIGDHPASCYKGDPEYVKEKISFYRPAIIVGCGKIAHQALNEAGVVFLPVPHPAFRCLSKKTTSNIKALLADA
jgi:hypothetical protein